MSLINLRSAYIFHAWKIKISSHFEKFFIAKNEDKIKEEWAQNKTHRRISNINR